MPHTLKTGRYYTIVAGKRKYNPKYDKKVTPVVRAAPRAAPRAARAAKGVSYTGYGSYSTKSVKKERSGGEEFGRQLGGVVGKGLQALFKHLTGFGDYHVENNTLMTGGLSPPQIVNSSSHGGFIVRHREYLGDIEATTAFALASYPLNPGMSESFPWLSTVANSFEQYKWRGVVFEFKSLSSDAILSASTSSALGAVIMATEYNSLNDNFADKNEMENHEFSNSRKPSLNFLHPVECKGSLTSIDLLYVRSGAIPSNADLRLYDLGKTEIATVGMQAASGVAGELWVTYEVELYKPQIPDNDTESQSAHISLGGLMSSSAPFGGGVLTAGSTLNMTYAGALVTFPTNVKKMKYYISYYMKADAQSINLPAVTLTSLVGCSAVDLFSAGLTIIQGPAATGSGIFFMFDACIQVEEPSNASFTVTMTGALPSGNTVGDFIVTEMPSGITLNALSKKHRKHKKKKPVRIIEVSDSEDSSSSEEETVIVKKKKDKQPVKA